MNLDREPVGRKSIALTFDIDWAPDFIIDLVADMLIVQRVKATWFVTHQCAAVARLKDRPDLFELGIHPNFLPGSSHGTNPSAILAHCLSIVPEARSMRTHGLVQSSPLLKLVMDETPIRTDVSLFLPLHLGLRPVEYRSAGRSMQRIPYFWEDDWAMEVPGGAWDVVSLVDNDDALAVFDFHPIHVYLNSPNLLPWNRLKNSVQHLPSARPEQIDPWIQHGPGTRTAFDALLGYLASGRAVSATISELAPAEPRSPRGPF